MDKTASDSELRNSPRYQAAIGKLIQRVQVCHENKWSPTEARKECERVAKALDDIAELLATTSEGMRIEEVHEERGKPERKLGLDGRLIEEENYIEWPSYEGIKWKIRDLADSARKAAADLPDPRTKFALRHAATGMLHLYHWHGISCPTIYIDGEGVLELTEIAEKAGIVLSREAYRKALREALNAFDKHYSPEFNYLDY